MVESRGLFELLPLVWLLLNEPVSHSCSMAGPGEGAAFMAALADAGLDLKTKQAVATIHNKLNNCAHTEKTKSSRGMN